MVISWPGCTLDDPRLGQFAEALAAGRQARQENGQAELYRQVLTGYSMLRMLMDEPAELTRAEALRRLRGVLVGPDGETSCAVRGTHRLRAKQRQETMQAILEGAVRVTGLDPDQFRMAGATIDGLAIDRESVSLHPILRPPLRPDFADPVRHLPAVGVAHAAHCRGGRRSVRD